MIAALAALAIVLQDHTPLRAEPRSGATELAELWQGEVLEVRGQRADYYQVYDYARERGGYLSIRALRQVSLGEADAPELLAVRRFLRDLPGSEALGISYGAAYLKAAPPRTLTAEPFYAIATMAQRLADQATGSGPGAGAHTAEVGAHIEVAGQFGVHLRSFNRNGRVQVCYDGELFRSALAQTGASAEERAGAVLGLTRPECIDPDLGPAARAAFDGERRDLLEQVGEQGLTDVTRSRLHARRAAVWAAIAFERARVREPADAAAQHALGELRSVRPTDLGDDGRTEYADAAIRVSTIRWALGADPAAASPLALGATAGEPGQTCLVLTDAARSRNSEVARRCTYGVPWMRSVRSIPGARALALAVQPLESWLELWVFRERAGSWTVDVISPGAEDPEQGYVEFAGYVPRSRRLLVVREAREHGRLHRRFEELRLADLTPVLEAGAPELLPEFGRWQDPLWRRDTLALR